jgi:beta-lactamase superfamily II metal-dependent hydrolase
MVTLIAGLALAGVVGVGRDGLQAQAGKSKPLDIQFIDVEGGQATLIVSPSGQSLLVDAGWPGFEGRDADRIAAAAKKAGVTQIDYFMATHYHTDHIGGVPQLAGKLPIRTFVDHGPSVESGERPDALFKAYADVRAKGKHLQVKPGDKIPIAGLDVQVVAAGGEHLAKAINGGGQPNALCADFKPKEADPSENARSVGMVLSFGSFRMLDLGDLTWNKEHDLVCPNNLVGTVDLYLTTHHGLDQSGPAALVHAVAPRVAIMNNGAKKGGMASAWKNIRDSPGLEDLWQLHYAVDAGAEANVAESFIANRDETTAHGIRVSAGRDGRFTVTNTRNGMSKTYQPRRALASRQ